jgi:hypothetical protein
MDALAHLLRQRQLLHRAPRSCRLSKGDHCVSPQAQRGAHGAQLLPRPGLLRGRLVHLLGGLRRCSCEKGWDWMPLDTSCKSS